MPAAENHPSLLMKEATSSTRLSAPDERDHNMRLSDHAHPWRLTFASAAGHLIQACAPMNDIPRCFNP